ncbi:MAG: Fpg/Nei family DNA glycosylase [Promethearchaeota archaeon]
MPELPEVEIFKEYFDKTSLNQKIDNVFIRDHRVLNVQETIFKKTIKSNTFYSSVRHGKYLFSKLNSGFIVFHFGMSGDLKYFNDIKEEPNHSRILFEFTNGNFLSYVSQRMFGRVDLTNDIADFIINKKNLGVDALKMNFEEFKKSLEKRTAFAKSALMNQSIIAGIGNIYSDEILFQAKIHPKTKINKISNSKLRELFETIKKVLKVGIEKKGILNTYPNEFIIPHRKINEYCPNCGGKIQRFEISQRHGFYCPNCQIQYNEISDE